MIYIKRKLSKYQQSQATEQYCMMQISWQGTVYVND